LLGDAGMVALGKVKIEREWKTNLHGNLLLNELGLLVSRRF
jgi:hypothetical protein